MPTVAISAQDEWVVGILVVAALATAVWVIVEKIMRPTWHGLRSLVRLADTLDEVRPHITRLPAMLARLNQLETIAAMAPTLERVGLEFVTNDGSTLVDKVGQISVDMSEVKRQMEHHIVAGHGGTVEQMTTTRRRR
jgi:hypothetical protein